MALTEATRTSLLMQAHDMTTTPAINLLHKSAHNWCKVVTRCDEIWKKLPFQAAHDVDELLIVDSSTHPIDRRGKYRPIEHGGLIDLGAGESARADRLAADRAGPVVEQRGWCQQSTAKQVRTFVPAIGPSEAGPAGT